MTKKQTVGILAIQGDFAEHAVILKQLKVASMEVRTCEDLEQVDRLIMRTVKLLMYSTQLMKVVIQL
jgi:glutamine amidotransferase PdxT